MRLFSIQDRPNLVAQHRRLELNTASPQSKGVVGGWMFDHDGGDTAFDFSGAGRDLVCSQGFGTIVTWVHDSPGAVLDFDGGQPLTMNVTDGAFTFGTAEFAVSIWLRKMAVGAGYDGAWAIGSFAPTLYLRTPGGDRPSLYHGGQLDFDNVALPTDRYIHLVYVRRGTTGYLYRDGVQDSTTITHGGNITSNIFSVGDDGAVGQPLEGRVKCCVVYDYAPTEGLIAEMYRRPLDIVFVPRIFQALSPISAAVSGTATDTIDEADVVAGGKTIIITLTGDTWVAAGATFDAQRQNIIDGLDSAQSEGTGWNAEVRDKEVVGAVVRTSDTVVTITLTAAAAYDITAQETITVTVPATALVTSTGDLTATPTFTVDVVAVGYIPYPRGHGEFGGLSDGMTGGLNA